MMTDPKEWFDHPEHDHIKGLDAELEQMLRVEFMDSAINVDCGVEGKGPFTYHFRIKNVQAKQHGSVCNRAIDLLSSWTPYRYEVQCV